MILRASRPRFESVSARRYRKLIYPEGSDEHPSSQVSQDKLRRLYNQGQIQSILIILLQALHIPKRSTSAIVSPSNRRCAYSGRALEVSSVRNDLRVYVDWPNCIRCASSAPESGCFPLALGSLLDKEITMVLRPLRRWFTPKDFVSNHTSRLLCQRGRFHRPQFERLEDRLAPATHTWTGATSGLWSVNSNWTGGSPATDPNAALVFPAGASNLANNNDLNFPTIISITYTGSGYLTTGNPVTFPSSGSPQTIAVAAGVAGVDTFNPGIIFGVGTVTANVTSAGATLTLGGKLSETAMSNLNITGAGTLVLTGNNTYTGGTNLAGGTLAVGSNTALGTGGLSLSGGTNIQATGGAISLNNTLSINGDITIGGTNNLTFTGATTLSAGVSGAPITLTATNTGLTTFGGQLSTNLSIFAPISVNTAGPGTVVIAGTGNYSVPTVVTAGTLLVNGALPTSDVMVNSGATFGGSGVVQTITANGTVSPGGPGTAILQTGTATFNAGSTLTVKLNGTAAGSGYDQLNASSAVDLT